MSVSAKGSHVLAITKFGEVFAWGRGDEGQLGNGKRVGSNTPYKIKSLSSWNIIQVSCGKSHSLALDAKGRVLAWGYEYVECIVFMDMMCNVDVEMKDNWVEEIQKVQLNLIVLYN